jgi:hypothetical protein
MTALITKINGKLGLGAPSSMPVTCWLALTAPHLCTIENDTIDCAVGHAALQIGGGLSRCQSIEGAGIPQNKPVEQPMSRKNQASILDSVAVQVMKPMSFLTLRNPGRGAKPSSTTGMSPPVGQRQKNQGSDRQFYRRLSINFLASTNRLNKRPRD